MAEHDSNTPAHETELGPHKRNAVPTEAQTPQVQAKLTAKEVGQILFNESIDAAYKELTGDLNTARTSMSGADFKRYRKDLTTSLEDTGLLPQLSLAWADKAFSKLDADQSQSVEKREALAYSERTNELDELSASMAKNFAKTMFEMSDVPATRKDLRSLINEKSPLVNEERSKLVVSFLGRPRPYLNDMSILEVLDLIGAEGNPNEFDGKISKRDIESFIRSSRMNPLFDSLSKNDRAFLTTIVENWEHHEVKRLRDERGLITPNSINSATGELRARRAHESFQRQQREQDAKERHLFGRTFPSAIKL